MNNDAGDQIETRARFDFVRYANCWEDAEVLCEALCPASGRRILSIASAGDNAFALAAEGSEVVACDLNPAQIACSELKAAALGYLDHESVLKFLGIEDAAGGYRGKIYESLRTSLSSGYRAYWDSRPAVIARGFIHDGKFEQYFGLFRRRILPLLAGKKKLDQLFADRSKEDRERFYGQEWNTWRWRLLFKVFFSRTVMGYMGRDPEFFRYVEGSVSERILSRTRYALTQLPTHSNPYLRYILTGNFRPALPRYLRPEQYSKVQEGAARVKFVCLPIQEAARQFRGDGFSGFNLSDIFEYLNEDLSEKLYGEILAAAEPGARLAYWNMLVPRRRPDRYASRVASLDALADRLFQADRAFFYSAFVVEEVHA